MSASVSADSGADARASESGGRRLAGRAAWVTFAGAVVVQLTFALNGGNIPLTVASVILLTSTATLHAGSVGGWRFAFGALGIVAVLTWAAEAIGIATGFPFGEYAYTGSLGPEIAGVSLLVLLAWLTLAYPSYVVANRLVGPGTGWRKVARIGLAGFALTAWDVFLDPQMVEAGNWGWANPEPSLPGTPGIPLTNYGGWLLTAVLIAIALDSLHSVARKRWGARDLGNPAHQRADRVPYAVYLWTYVSCILGNATFWERPSVALAGGIAMGLVAIPLAVVLFRSSRAGRVLPGGGRVSPDGGRVSPGGGRVLPGGGRVAHDGEAGGPAEVARDGAEVARDPAEVARHGDLDGDRDRDGAGRRGPH